MTQPTMRDDDDGLSGKKVSFVDAPLIEYYYNKVEMDG